MPTCLVCDADALCALKTPALPGVTSDGLAYPRGGQLDACEACGHVQRRLDADWQAAVDRIYADYAIYHLSDGVEQKVFAADGAETSRSDSVLRRLLAEHPLPAAGSLLDLGCGNGVLLSTFHRLRPDWSLFGHELHDANRAHIEGLAGVSGFFSGPLPGIERRFDAITLMHVAEHLTTPVETLAEVRALLAPEGRLLIQVPYWVENPFDLFVYDHVSFFTPARLAQVVGRAGFEVLDLATDWVRKEISLVARAGEGPAPAADAVDDPAARARRLLGWAGNLLEDTRARLAEGGGGLLGTATAGTWLGGGLGELDFFFVDEDRSRVGKEHLGHRVLHPEDVPAGATVIMGLPPVLAEAIHPRLRERYPAIEWVLPPAL